VQVLRVHCGLALRQPLPRSTREDSSMAYCNDGMHYLGEPVVEQLGHEREWEFEERVGPEGSKPRQDIWMENDRRGIPIGVVCKKCVKKQRSKYR